MATDSLKDCLKINPKYPLAWKAIGHIFYENYNSIHAAKYYSRALECDPTDLESKIGLANCHYL